MHSIQKMAEKINNGDGEQRTDGKNRMISLNSAISATFANVLNDPLKGRGYQIRF